MTSSRLQLFLLALSLYILYFLHLGELPFLGADEPRYARIGEEMLQTGDFVTPTLNFKPWLEKPPLLFWVESLSFKLFGVSEASARLPVAILSLLAALGCAFLLSKSRGRRAGLLSLLILSSCPLFIVFSRAASMDGPLVAFLTIAFLAAFQAHLTGGLAPALVSAIALGLATLAKGPVALVVALSLMVCFRTLRNRPFWNLRQLTGGLFMLAVTTVPWFWLVWEARGDDFVVTFVWNHHLARYLTDIHHHSQPLWFFLPVIVAGCFPWVVFLGSSLARIWKKPSSLLDGKTGLQLYLWLWVAVPFLFFSLSASKLPGYILPIVPPLAMLIALEWDRLFDRQVAAIRMLRVELALVSAGAVMIGLTLLFGARSQYESSSAGLLLATPLLAGALLLHWPFRGYPLKIVFAILTGTMVLFTGLAFWQVAPRVASFHSSKGLVQGSRHRLSPAQPLIFYRFFHHTANYYSGYQTLPESIENLESLKVYLVEHPQENYLVLTQKDGFGELSGQLDILRVQADGNQFLLEVAPLSSQE